MPVDALTLLRRYGGPVPRYTSYPTAPHFHAGVDGPMVARWLRDTRSETASVYVHLPFCKSLCLYCGCNMKVTHNKDVITAYVEALLTEIRRTTALLPRRLKVSTLHFGGGTPSYCPPDDTRRLFSLLREVFDILPDAEVSMEMDPRQMPDETLATLAEMGLNRASLGIQDTNAEVQKVIARVQPHALNVRAVQALRAMGIEGINVDLLYGLPKQTDATIRQTVEDIMELRPQRIALFGYAHVPWMKKHQAVLEPHGLPDAAERLALFEVATACLTREGYVPVGIDHFCKPDDPMALRLQQTDVHRNFMGYTTDDAPLLLGFGASAISQYEQGYAQNVVSPADYEKAVATIELPVVRGIALAPEDAARRAVIEQLLCHMRVDLSRVLAPFTLDASVFQESLGKLASLLDDGLVRWDGPQNLVITDIGRPYARVVAACFDTYLSKGTGRHSKAV